MLNVCMHRVLSGEIVIASNDFYSDLLVFLNPVWQLKVGQSTKFNKLAQDVSLLSLRPEKCSKCIYVISLAFLCRSKCNDSLLVLCQEGIISVYLTLWRLFKVIYG